jgi:hypothetical protein
MTKVKNQIACVDSQTTSDDLQGLTPCKHDTSATDAADGLKQEVSAGARRQSDDLQGLPPSEYDTSTTVFCFSAKGCVECTDTFLDLGNLWRKIRRTGDLMALSLAFSKIVREHPDCLMARTMLASAYLDTHQFQKCIAECDKLLAVTDYDMSVLFIKGIALLEMGKTLEAAACFMPQYLADSDKFDNPRNQDGTPCDSLGKLADGLEAFGRPEIAESVRDFKRSLDKAFAGYHATLYGKASFMWIGELQDGEDIPVLA